MDKALYITAAGADVVMQSQQVHANNLANVGTAGFRKDFVSSYGVALEGDGLGSRVIPKIRGLGSRFSAGVMEKTGRSLDVAINGDGWLSVEDRRGEEAYTRSGQLKIDAERTLLTEQGLPVLGEGGPITLPPFQSVFIGHDGVITVQPLEGGEVAEAGRLKLVNPEERLTKGVDGLFRLAEGDADIDEDVRLRSGYIEGSNVNALEEMLSFLSLSRQFEAQMKLMKAAGDMASSGDRLMREQ